MTTQTAIESPRQTAGTPLGAQAPGWVMLARTGTWLGHPSAGGGQELITMAQLRSALEYFDRHYAAHGAELVIDYHHASVVAPRLGTPAPAAGWIRRMELRGGGAELWGRVMWTAEAAGAIARREFRYLSPVFRFNAPDRVTGKPIPMMIHSMALTNTPFLTELESLNSNEEKVAGRNEAAATDGSGKPGASVEGGESMSVLDSLAAALEMEPEQVASRLGLSDEAAAEEKTLAEAILVNAAKAHEPAPSALPGFVTNGLNVPPDADETKVRAAVIRLKSHGVSLAAVREKLGLAEDAPDAELLNAIGSLQEAGCEREAEELVQEAIKAGKVPPAHRNFYLREALHDLAAAREVINSLPVGMAPRQGSGRAPRQGSGQALERGAAQAIISQGLRTGARGLTQSEEAVCRQLGLKPEMFAAARAE